MLALVQRVSSARVEVEGSVVGAIDAGLAVLVCAERGDGPDTADRLLDKLLRLRIFSDAQGRMNQSLMDRTEGGLLLVSQFTLAAVTQGGHRPSFDAAAPAALARPLFDHLVAAARARHGCVASGVFGADMRLHLVNEGPVTIPLQVKSGGNRPRA
jgi:D-aminoacyl-tRNA deacylase